jgi:dipeptidyl aminopeptidase/acylaminoacyl peptidase
MRIFAAALTSLVLGLSCVPALAVPPGANGRIAFEQQREGNYDIWTIDPDGTDAQPLFAGPTAERHPAWSPDGERIAFSSNGRLWVANADGSDGREIVAKGDFPTWSPDGTMIAFDAGGQVAVVDADGTGRKIIAQGGAPSWSPNGPEVLYMRWAGPTAGFQPQDGFHVVRCDGVQGRQIANFRLQGRGDWGPDGTRFVYARTLPGANPCEVYSRRIDGSEEKNLSQRMYDEDPAWSPDGAKIVFVNVASQTTDLWLMGPDGRNRTRITNDVLRQSAPAWQPRLRPGQHLPRVDCSGRTPGPSVTVHATRTATPSAAPTASPAPSLAPSVTPTPSPSPAPDSASPARRRRVTGPALAAGAMALVAASAAAAWRRANR